MAIQVDLADVNTAESLYVQWDYGQTLEITDQPDKLPEHVDVCFAPLGTAVAAIHVGRTSTASKHIRPSGQGWWMYKQNM